MFLTTCSVCGIFLHMLSYRDRYHWKAEERANRARISASSKNFSSDAVKRFERRMISCAELGAGQRRRRRMAHLFKRQPRKTGAPPLDSTVKGLPPAILPDRSCTFVRLLRLQSLP